MRPQPFHLNGRRGGSSNRAPRRVNMSKPKGISRQLGWSGGEDWTFKPETAAKKSKVIVAHIGGMTRAQSRTFALADPVPCA